jgi:hypothetical protein
LQNFISTMLKIKTIILLTSGFCLTIASCDRVRSKGHQIVAKTKQEIRNKADAVGDKIISRFDDTKPDTKFNKQRFQEFFGFYPTPDVKNIYAHSDELGIDASYYFAFECADSTVEKIKRSLSLSVDTTGMGFSGGLNLSPTFWWDTVAIQQIKPFSRQRENLYWYLWFDKVKRKVYFMTFDT